METKNCKDCRLPLLITDFAIHHRTPDGKEYRQSSCKVCVKKYNENYYRLKAESIKAGAAQYRAQNKGSIARRVEQRLLENSQYIQKIKEETPCTDCGIDRLPPFCMDFDHLEGTDKRCNVSKMMMSAYSLKTLKEEIAKCELVCSNCHRLRTLRRSTNAHRRIGQ